MSYITYQQAAAGALFLIASALILMMLMYRSLYKRVERLERKELERDPQSPRRWKMNLPSRTEVN